MVFMPKHTAGMAVNHKITDGTFIANDKVAPKTEKIFNSRTSRLTASDE